MRLGLIFTNDWELYGDGSGDYFEVQHEQMLKLLDLMPDYNAKMTIMAETAQQLSFLKLAGQNNNDYAKNVCKAWEELIKSAIKNGHDVQLHFHPQWLNTEFKNDKWLLDNSKWSIGKLDKNIIDNIIKESKNYLENLLVPIKNDYKCQCFRAGAYYIEPSENVLDVLIKYGFTCDTSVTKGLISEGNFNFTNAFSNILPYPVKDDVKIKNTDSNFFEFPIYSYISYDSPALRKFLPNIYFNLKYKIKPSNIEIDWARKRDKLKNLRYPKENRFYRTNQKKGFSFYLKQFISKNAVQLDYDYLYSSEFVKLVENIFKEKDLKKFRDSDLIIPVVASGHIKDIPNIDNMKRILELISEKLSAQVTYITLTEAVKIVEQNSMLNL